MAEGPANHTRRRRYSGRNPRVFHEHFGGTPLVALQIGNRPFDGEQREAGIHATARELEPQAWVLQQAGHTLQQLDRGRTALLSFHAAIIPLVRFSREQAYMALRVDH